MWTKPSIIVGRNGQCSCHDLTILLSAGMVHPCNTSILLAEDQLQKKNSCDTEPVFRQMTNKDEVHKSQLSHIESYAMPFLGFPYPQFPLYDLLIIILIFFVSSFFIPFIKYYC